MVQEAGNEEKQIKIPSDFRVISISNNAEGDQVSDIQDIYAPFNQFPDDYYLVNSFRGTFGNIFNERVHPNLVIIDDTLIQHERWNIDIAFLQELALQRKDKHINRVLKRLHLGGLMEDLRNELTTPDVLNYALFLRLLGYRGKILVKSNIPPETRDLRHKRLAAWFLTKDLDLPLIDGFIWEDFEDGELLYGYYKRDYLRGKTVHYNFYLQSEDSDRHVAIRNLMTSLFGFGKLEE